MRKLAWFAFSFSFGVFLCQYLVPVRLRLLLAGAAALLGLILYALLRGGGRRAAVVAGVGLALGFAWCFGFDTLIFSGARAMDGATAQVRAEVLDFPVETDRGSYVDVRLSDSAAHGLKARAYFYEDETDGLRPGDEVAFEALFSASDRVGDEPVTSFTSKGIFLFARSARDLQVLASPGMRFHNFHVYLAKSIREKIREAFPADTEDFMLALLTGDRTGLNRDVETTAAMERAGVTHIVAISGMHVSILAGFLLTVLGRSPLGVALTIPVLLIFMAVSGFSASVVRAVVMQAAVLLAPMVYRESDSLTSLSLAMLLLLLVNPFAAAGVGFQLSFAATLGIILFTPRFQKALTARLPKKGAGRAVCLWLAGTFSATLGALLLTLPISALYFGCVSLVSPLVNLLILWAVSPAFLIGALAVGLSFLWLPLGRTAAFYPSLLVRYILLVVKLAARPFLAAVYLDGTAVKLWFAAVYLTLLGFAVFRVSPRRLIAPMSAATVALCAIFVVKDASAAARPGYTLTALDVGQGQSLVVTAGRYTAIVDCGTSSGVDAGETAERFVRGMGRGRVDLLVLTHYHADHANGVERLLASLQVEVLAVPEPRFTESELDEEILAAAESAGCRVLYVDEDTAVELGETTFNLFPPLGMETENERGLTALISGGDFDTLITGDAPAEQEIQLAGKYRLPDTEVLVVGHHGSATSTTERLLNAIRPETAVISVGENSYGHPAPEVLDRLEERGIAVFRTDENGTISIRSVS